MMQNPLTMAKNEKSKRPLYLRIWQHRYLYLMLLPAIIAIIVFHIAPLYGVQIAFRKYNAIDGIWGSRWVGFKYFTRMFREATFLTVLRNTVVISLLKLFLAFPFGVIFALLLNEIQNRKIKRVSQTISYLPHFISWVVFTGIIKSTLALNGPINQLIALVGGEKQYFLTKSSDFYAILVITEIWKGMGWGSIVYLAAIASIDRALYEAAEIDGASRLQRMYYVTLPSIMPVVLVLFVLKTGNILSAGFDQVFNLYSPVVYDVADILDTYVYRVGLLNTDFSYSTAIGLFKNIVGLILLLTVNQITKSREA